MSGDFYKFVDVNGLWEMPWRACDNIFMLCTVYETLCSMLFIMPVFVTL